MKMMNIYTRTKSAAAAAEDILRHLNNTDVDQ